MCCLFGFFKHIFCTVRGVQEALQRRACNAVGNLVIQGVLTLAYGSFSGLVIRSDAVCDRFLGQQSKLPQALLQGSDIIAGPEPTPTPYAPDGIISDEWKADVLEGDFEVYQETLQSGSTGAEVTRLQTRLACLWYYTSGIDGQFGPGTASAIEYFQKRNSMEQTGIADVAFQQHLYGSVTVPTEAPEAAADEEG